VLPRPLQGLQVAARSGEYTRVTHLQPVQEPSPMALVRPRPSQPLGGRAELPEPEPHPRPIEQPWAARGQHRRQPRPPHLREYGAGGGIQPLQHLLQDTGRGASGAGRAVATPLYMCAVLFLQGVASLLLCVFVWCDIRPTSAAASPKPWSRGASRNGIHSEA